MNNYKYPSSVQQKACDLYLAGMSLLEVADHLKIHYQTVTRYLKAAGIPRRGNYHQWTPEKIQQALLLYQSGLSLDAVASRLGGKRSTVRKYVQEAGFPIRGEGFYSSGDRNPAWKGGRHIQKGYVYLYCPDHPHRSKSNRVAEHRLVMEQTLGRNLEPQEVVHHLNGDTMDNRPENLQLYENNTVHLAATRSGRVPKWSEDGLKRLDIARRKPRRTWLDQLRNNSPAA